MTASARQGRVMRLSKELAALCHRHVSDEPVDARYDYFTDDDLDRVADKLLGTRPKGPFWLFAYGSLIWKPEVEHISLRRATAHGWHRAFSMQITAYRATPEQPGYMMCLDPGGHCEGVVLRLPEDGLHGQLRKMLIREIGGDEQLEAVRWIDVETETGPLTALVFYARPHLLHYYHENRPLAEIAHGLARACGPWGSGADYLCNSVAHLEELGIHDELLWELQEMVALEIERIHR